MDSRSEAIRSLGADYFDQIVADREEETLHLEFKTLTHNGGQLKREDRKMIAEAVSGLANAEGGVLIIGIATEKSDGIDVAAERRPIKSLERTTNLVRSSLPEMLSPQHIGLTAFSVEEREKADEGFIVIDVPPSPDRPHYSNVHHQYFRRGSDRTRVMEHGEIRDLMFATRHGRLQLRTSVELNLMTGGNFGFRLLLSLENIGRLPVKGPYLKAPGPYWHPASPGLLEVRRLKDGVTDLYANIDQLIHVEDEFQMAARTTGIRFNLMGEKQEIVARIRETRDCSLFRIIPPQDSTIGDQSFESIQVSFGGENALPQNVTINLSKLDMFDLMTPHILSQ